MGHVPEPRAGKQSSSVSSRSKAEPFIRRRGRCHGPILSRRKEPEHHCQRNNCQDLSVGAHAFKCPFAQRRGREQNTGIFGKRFIQVALNDCRQALRAPGSEQTEWRKPELPARNCSVISICPSAWGVSRRIRILPVSDHVVVPAKLIVTPDQDVVPGARLHLEVVQQVLQVVENQLVWVTPAVHYSMLDDNGPTPYERLLDSVKDFSGQDIWAVRRPPWSRITHGLITERRWSVARPS